MKGLPAFARGSALAMGCFAEVGNAWRQGLSVGFCVRGLGFRVWACFQGFRA